MDVRLIDAHVAEIKLIEILASAMAKRKTVYDASDALIEVVRSGTPTIDAVPVVRCKDCVYWRQDVNNLYGCMHWYCTHLLRKTMPDDYCNHGAKIWGKDGRG